MIPIPFRTAPEAETFLFSCDGPASVLYLIWGEQLAFCDQEGLVWFHPGTPEWRAYRSLALRTPS